jgi:hypothetical protein
LSVTFRGCVCVPMSAPVVATVVPATSPLDRVVTLFGIPIPLRDLGARCTRSFCVEGLEYAHPEHDILACQMVTSALRRRWSMPDLDLATQQLSDLTSAAVHVLIVYCRAVVRSCCQVYVGNVHELHCLEHHEKAVAERFALLPDRLPSVNCLPFAPIRWNRETPLPSLPAFGLPAFGLQQHVYQAQFPQQVAFLLGEPLPLQLCYYYYSDLVYGWSGQTSSWSDDQQKNARAVWSRVCTVRYPGIVMAVAEVFPVVGLPELVAEYVVGVVCTDGSRE